MISQNATTCTHMHILTSISNVFCVRSSISPFIHPTILISWLCIYRCASGAALRYRMAFCRKLATSQSIWFVWPISVQLWDFLSWMRQLRNLKGTFKPCWKQVSHSLFILYKRQCCHCALQHNYVYTSCTSKNVLLNAYHAALNEQVLNKFRIKYWWLCTTANHTDYHYMHIIYSKTSA
jgi:hypothetical protein